MISEVPVAIGGALALLAWLVPRQVAGARTYRLPAVLLDLLPVALAGGLLLIATGRPLFSGMVLLSLGAGFALADWAKRKALREPVVFTEMAEVRHLFTHPHLYLPFAGPWLVIGGALAAIGLCGALLVLEPSTAEPHPVLFFALAAAVVAAGRVLSREPALGFAATALRGLRPTGNPARDAATLGPFAILLVYGVIARAERRVRRARHAPPQRPARRPSPCVEPVPLLLVQCESFFDARRLSPLVPENLLSGFDACRRSGASFGRLEVSAWGANTMRAEFAVLTGIPEQELGYDRFNPYHAFARAPLASLARRLREEGYRTICLHPFDRDFFRRDLTLPALGFETFLGLESLGGSRRPPYYPDPDLAGHVLRMLDGEGPRVFVFAITMGNHGPWRDGALSCHSELARSIDPSRLPQGEELLRYLEGLRRSDEMLAILMEGIGRRGGEAMLGFYGDHLPSLPRAFDHFGFDEWGSDYVLWHGAASPAQRLDLPAHRLPAIILEKLHARGAIGRLDAIRAA